jgi:HK97 family phage prohead protease
MDKQREQRSVLEPVKLETRAEDDTSLPVIQGYAALFDVETEIGSRYGTFKESIAPGAFKNTLAQNKRVLSLFNHNFDYILGSTTAGTLRLKEDLRGLYFEVDPPDTQVGRDVTECIRRGDILGASFMFVITKEEWTIAKSKEEYDARRIMEVDLYECGPVTMAAYEATSVGLRSEASDEAHERARKEWEERNRPEEPVVIVHPEPYLLRARVLKASFPLSR